MEGMSREGVNNLENVRPIMTSIGTFETYDELKEKYPDLPNTDNDLGLEGATDINWHSNSRALEEAGFLNAGEYTYVISKIDNTSKISKGYGGCTGVLGSGVDINNGQYISFLTHQDLPDMNENQKAEFVRHLGQRFRELKDRCVPGSIDVVIIGGDSYFRKSKEYNSAVKLLTDEVEKNIGLDPVVIGPKNNGVYDNAYYDNEKRRLFLVRSDETTNNIIFKGSEIDEKSKQWKRP